MRLWVVQPPRCLATAWRTPGRNTRRTVRHPRAKRPISSSVSSRLRRDERSVVPGRVIHGPEFAVGARRAVGCYLWRLVVVGKVGDKGEPTFAAWGLQPFLAAHRGSISEWCCVKPTALEHRYPDPIGPSRAGSSHRTVGGGNGLEELIPASVENS